MNGVLVCGKRGLSLFLLMAAGLFFHTMAAYAAGPYGATQCAASRFGGNLGCTANDVSINTITVAGSPPAYCVGGQTIPLDLSVTVQFGSSTRYNIGVFIANDGKTPQLLPASGGASSCSVAVLPTTSPFLSLDANTCGDGNGTINGGTGAGTFLMPQVAVPCTTNGAGSITLYTPYLVSWDQNSGTSTSCLDNTYPVPGTTSKCNTGSVTFPPGFTIVVLPAISITDNVTTVRSGGALTYTVVITNTTASVLAAGAIFTDPAVTDLSISSVSCVAAGGATCPASPTVAAMQGAGITLPAMPINSTLTFTVVGSYVGSPTSPTTLINTANVIVSGYTNPASDTDTVMVPPTVTKSFSPSAIASGGTSTLTVTLTNPTATVNITGAAFTDSYPANMKNTTVAATTCPGGTATAAVNGTTLSLSGATIPQGGSCTVTVSVTTTTTGTNTTSTVTSGNAATGSAASATLTVLMPPTVAKNFGAGSINIGGATTLTITLTNPNSTAITGAAFTDTYPAGITNDGTPGVSNGCGGSVTAAANGTLLSLTGGTIPANGNCSIRVNVIGVQAGSFTNNSGTITTANAGNGTAASATLVINTTREAWYPLDNSLNYWADSSGNGHTGTPVGITTSNIVATPAAGSKPETCSGANIPTDTAALSVYALDTGVDVRSLGATHGGTIAFWYKGKAAWNEGASNNYDRTLFDATGSGSGEFWLVLQQGGSLKFAIDSAANVSQTATSSVQAIAAGTWAHVAVTWDFVAGTMCVYFNGALSGSCTSGITEAPSYGSLYMGDNRGNGTYDVNRGNSADGVIDEVYLYNGALTAAQIQVLMNAGHTCSNVDHYELSLPTGGITCLPTTATVTACSDNSSPCTSPLTTISGQTATLATSAGTLVPTTVTFNASGVASATLSYPAATDGAAASVTLSGEQTTATNSRKCCPNGINCVVANSCSTIFNTAGFIFSSSAGGGVATIPTQVAGTSSGTYYLRAVKTFDNSSHTCGAAFSGAQSVNFAYECNNPLTCSGSDLMSINAGAATTIARNNNGGHASTTPVNMTFDVNGNAPFTFIYSDVGQVTLWANKTVNSAVLTGSTNPFVVKPGGFVLSNIVRTSDSFGNPAAADASGAKFVKAGENFSVTVTATTTPASGATTTPNYGKETAPETVKLTPALVVGLGQTNIPALANSTAFGAFTNGVATGTTFNWPEVGIITLTPSVGDADYLGGGDVTGTASPNVGRFSPDHFVLTGTPAVATRNDLSCSPASTFTYMGESLGVSFTLEARNASDVLTQNYRDGGSAAQHFSKLDGTTVSKWTQYAANDSLGLWGIGIMGAPYATCKGVFSTISPYNTTYAVPPCPTTPSSPIAQSPVALRIAVSPSPSGSWTTGSGSFGASLTVGRAALADGPYFVSMGVAPQDADGITLLPAAFNLDADNSGTSERKLLGQPEVRFGRLRLLNAYGSELLPILVPVRAEYWNNGSWQVNQNDSCTVLTPGALAIGDVTRPAGSSLAFSTPPTGVTGFPSATLAAGAGAGTTNLRLTPSVNGVGSADVILNLGGTIGMASCVTLISPVGGATPAPILPYLAGNWCGAAYDKAPVARVKFGSPKAPYIYLRERY